ncbi:MAG: iron ABC transporter permease [Thermoanaerobaculia bacterium]|nr:iron ABC transporter permease [Thermoanaerobaculia bacterium]
MRASSRWLLGLLSLLVLLAFVADLATGSVPIPLGATVTVLLGGEVADPGWSSILLDLRMPRAITAALAGAALSVAGLLMQTFFRNPVAGPFVLGISSGASLGVALVVLGGSAGVLGVAGSLGNVAAAILGAGAVLALVVAAARFVPTLTLLILGVLFGYAATALVSILLRFASPESVQGYVIWTQGEFGGVSWNDLGLLAPVLAVGLAMGFAAVKPLNALLLGEAYARSMGVEVQRARLWLIAATALLAGAVTAFCGPIGFLGVAVPHLGRGLLHTTDHRPLLPAVALLGATLALVADIVAQVPGSPMALPLNAITALLGAPVVIWVIVSRRALRDSGAV